MRIQHNIMAMSAYRNYTNNVSAMKKNLEKLSSGYKINRAGDDAAGLAISEKMRAQITGLETAQKNAKDGISLVQTAEGALTEVHDMLNRMVELATQSANGTYDDTTDRYQLQKELDQLRAEIDRIADGSNFNGIKLLDGSLGLNSAAFEIGASTAYVAAGADVDGTIASTAFGSTHGNVAVAGQPPKFSINLKDLQLVCTSSGEITFAINIGDVTIKGTIAASKGYKAGDTIKLTDVMAALTAAVAAGSSNGSNLKSVASSVCAVIGGAYFSIKKEGNTGFIFEFFAASSGASASQDWADVGTKTLADNINAVLGRSVTVSGGTGIAVVKDGEGDDIDHSWVCDVYAVQDAVAPEPKNNWGVDLDIASLVQDGYKLVIGSTTYVFKTDKDSDYSDYSNVIDVSMFTSAADQKKYAALQLAGGLSSDAEGHAGGQAQIIGDLTISYKGGTTIHIDVEPDTDTDKAIKKTEDLLKLFKLSKPSTQQAAAANTKLTVKDANKIVKGNALTIDGQKIEFDEDKTYTINDVKDKIEALKDDDGNQLYTVKVNGNELTISTKTASADVKAPMILGKGLTLQIGDTADSYNQLNVGVKDCHVSSLGIADTDISIATQDEAMAAVDAIKEAINYVSDVRGTLGATQNRLDHTINNLSVMTENIQDAESTIRDTDIAEEMMAYTKNNILIQSAQAMLAQANQVPQGVLQLLQ